MKLFLEKEVMKSWTSLHPRYSTWYGYAKMKKDLTEIKELAEEMRRKKGVRDE